MVYLNNQLQDRPTVNIFIDMYPYPCNDCNDIRTIKEIIGGYIIKVCGVQSDNITFRVYNGKYGNFRIYNDDESEQEDSEYDDSDEDDKEGDEDEEEDGGRSK